MIFKLSYLDSNLPLTPGYLNPALNNSAQFNTSEDVRWNIRNVKLNFFLSFQKCVIFPFVYHRSLLFVSS